MVMGFLFVLAHNLKTCALSNPYSYTSIYLHIPLYNLLSSHYFNRGVKANRRKVYKDEQKYTNMESIRAYRFRIYPDTKRQKEIDKRIVLAQQLYNTILEKAKSEYEKNKITNMSKSTLNRYMKEAINENKDFLKLYSQTRQEIFVRLQKAYQNFFHRCEEKKAGKRVKAGFPRFKSIDRYKSITYRRTTVLSQ